MTLHMPGGVLMSRLNVYDSVAPDGQRGGTPHVHLLCTEMYTILAGSGAVDMLDMNGLSRVEVTAGDALVFSPGTLHRLINPHGDLEILVIMSNSGLPERGDNVVCFTDEQFATDAAYAEAMRVTSLHDATVRRDRGVEGFCKLVAAFERSLDEGRADLTRFYAQAEARTRPQFGLWRKTIDNGAAAEVAQTFAALHRLERGDTSYLADASHALLRPSAVTPGFCGHLNRYFDPATLALEGSAAT
jgi:mannose-6-phosphate isomerase-like protein (cupin superfamily)